MPILWQVFVEHQLSPGPRRDICSGGRKPASDRRTGWRKTHDEDWSSLVHGEGAPCNRVDWPRPTQVCFQFAPGPASASLCEAGPTWPAPSSVSPPVKGGGGWVFLQVSPVDSLHQNHLRVGDVVKMQISGPHSRASDRGPQKVGLGYEVIMHSLWGF